MTTSDFQRVRAAISAQAEPPRASEKAKNWVGRLIADELGIDIGPGGKDERTEGQNTNRARIRRMLKEWERTGAPRIENHPSARNGREVPVVVVGETPEGDETEHGFPGGEFS